MIQIKDFVKDYGTLRAVDNINFEGREGEILGFLGPNGAGKSTTLKAITGYLAPTAGNIHVKDFNIYDHPKEIKKLIGYLPEQNPLYDDMTVYNYLKFIADIRGISNEEFPKKLKSVLSSCGLKEVVGKPIHTLSKGYKQRVGLAQAIIHDPKILILDEPTTGLDPNQIKEIRELIKKLGESKTLIISSHILQEVKAVCDRVVIINKGKIVANEKTVDLETNFEEKTKLVLEIYSEEFDFDKLSENVEGVMVSNVEPLENSYKVILEYEAGTDKREDIYKFIKQQDWILLEMKREYVSLEDVFRNLTIEEGGQSE